MAEIYSIETGKRIAVTDCSEEPHQALESLDSVITLLAFLGLSFYAKKVESPKLWESYCLLCELKTEMKTRPEIYS